MENGKPIAIIGNIAIYGFFLLAFASVGFCVAGRHGDTLTQDTHTQDTHTQDTGAYASL